MSVDACKAAIKLVHQHTVSSKMTIPCNTISARQYLVSHEVADIAPEGLKKGSQILKVEPLIERPPWTNQLVATYVSI